MCVLCLGKAQARRTGGEVANALVCKTSIRRFDPDPVLQIEEQKGHPVGWPFCSDPYPSSSFASVRLSKRFRNPPVSSMRKHCGVGCMDLRHVSTLDALSQQLLVMTARIEGGGGGRALELERLALMELISRERVGQASQMVWKPDTPCLA